MEFDYLKDSQKCSQCGRCCIEVSCGILGENLPCKALEKKGDKYYCGMVIHPDKYLDLGKFAEWKRYYLKNFIAKSLGINKGCDSNFSEVIDE